MLATKFENQESNTKISRNEVHLPKIKMVFLHFPPHQRAVPAPKSPSVIGKEPHFQFLDMDG